MLIIKRINNVYKKVENVMVLIAGILLIVMMLLISAEIIIRKIGGASIPGVFEITTEIMTAVTLLGIAFVQREKEHIQIDVFSDWMPEYMTKIIELFVYVVAAVLLFTFGLQGFDSVKSAFITGEHTIGVFSVPLWPGKLVVTIAFFVACIRFFLDVFLTFDDYFIKRSDTKGC